MVLSGAAEAGLSSTDAAAATTAFRVAFIPCPRLGLRLFACTHGQGEPTWLIGLLLASHARGTDCCPCFDAAARKSNSWRPPPQLEGAASGTACRCCGVCSRIARYGVSNTRDWLHRTYPKVGADSHLVEQTRRLNNLTTLTTAAHKHTQKTRVFHLQQRLHTQVVFPANSHILQIFCWASAISTRRVSGCHSHAAPRFLSLCSSSDGRCTVATQQHLGVLADVQGMVKCLKQLRRQVIPADHNHGIEARQGDTSMVAMHPKSFCLPMGCRSWPMCICPAWQLRRSLGEVQRQQVGRHQLADRAQHGQEPGALVPLHVLPQPRPEVEAADAQLPEHKRLPCEGRWLA